MNTGLIKDKFVHREIGNESYANTERCGLTEVQQQNNFIDSRLPTESKSMKIYGTKCKLPFYCKPLCKK